MEEVKKVVGECKGESSSNLALEILGGRELIPKSKR